MRTSQAISASTSMAIVFRICACISSAWLGVAVLPVPMAQTGSYAKMSRCTCSGERPASAPLSCLSTTASARPASRSARVSPTQMIGIRPVARAAPLFLFTLSSVSPKYCRRSDPICQGAIDKLILKLCHNLRLFLSHCLTEVVGLVQTKTGQPVGNTHYLFLIQDYSD